MVVSNKSLFKKLFVLVFILSISTKPLCTFATDYYISPTGSDSNPGNSPDLPWQSILKVNSRTFSAGDRILFEAGATFDGGLYFDSSDSGTPQSPVTVSSYGTDRATISSSNSEGLYAYNCQGFVVRNLNFVGSGRTDPTGTSGIFFYMDLPGDAKLNHIIIEDVNVSGYRATGIIIGAWNGLSGFENVQIANSVAHDNGDKGIYVYGDWTVTTGWSNRNVCIKHCKAYNNAGNPGWTPHSGNGIMVSQVDGAIIEYCEAYNNGWLCDAPGGGPVGIWAWDSNNAVIQFCESHHNKTSGGDGGGFDLDGGCVNCVMQYNYSHDNHGAGLLICQFSNARQFNNNIVRYNISQSDGIASRSPMGAIHFWSSGSAGGINNTTLHNNTIYLSNDSRGAAIQVDSGRIYNTRFHNNIIYTVPNKRAVSVGNTNGGYHFQGNCYWASGGAVKIKWLSTIYNGLAEWRTATGQEKLDGSDIGFQCDPKLKSPGTSGTIAEPNLLPTLTAYKLEPNSPMIDSALDLPELFGIEMPARDFYGNTLPQRMGLDMGVHEFSPIRGDFEPDGDVDLYDFAILASAWQAEPNFGNWNQLCDISKPKDNKIDLKDLSEINKNWLTGNQ